MNRKRYERWTGSIVCLGLFFALYGCAALVAGGAAAGGTYIYTKGWVARDYNVGLERAYNAAIQAAQNLEMTVSEQNKKVASASIKAKKGGEDYWIKMEESGEDRTTISVRTGVMGDKNSSQKVHESIAKLL